MLTGFRFIELNQNINTLVKTLQTDMEVSRPYTFLSRLPIVDTENGEVFGTYDGQVFAADVIADDQEAVIVEGGSYQTFRAGQIPKVKLGSRVGEGMIRQLQNLSDSVNITDGDAELITGWENRMALNLVEGIRTRMNVLACAMMLDDVSYDRLGIKIDGTWNTPADLKVVLSGADRWISGNTAATPLADIREMQRVARTYGQVYDRITMAGDTFLAVTQTDEFKDNINFLYRFEVPAGAIPTSTRTLVELFEQMTGLILELEDSTYRQRAAGGANEIHRVFPEEKVLFSNSADDGNASVMDYSNGTVIESLVAPLANAAIREAVGGEQRGPYAYYNTNPTLNPPDLVAWAVQAGWPRKHIPEATATFTMNTV
jgi:hypothetical protein